VFEYWSHAAAYLPLKDYRHALVRMRRLAEGETHWFKREKKLMDRVLDRVRAEGPLQSRDFEPPPQARGKRKPAVWFEWTPTKRALEQLFMEGRLMVSHRKGFQKVHDLPERVHPDWVDREPPTHLDHARYLIDQALRSHGIAQEEEMRYLRKKIRPELARALRELEESGEIRLLEIAGVPGRKFYARTRELEAGLSRSPGDAAYRILSPFDNSVIQRKRLELLFGYLYQIECYVPAPKRKHGYFCLPLLKGDRFAGRIDAKADRKTRVLHVQKLIFEPGHRAAAVTPGLKRELERFAAFNGCDRIEVHLILKGTSA
jgi:hypothetical protein